MVELKRVHYLMAFIVHKGDSPHSFFFLFFFFLQKQVKVKRVKEVNYTKTSESKKEVKKIS